MPRVIRNKSFSEKFLSNISNFKLFLVLGLLTIGTGLTYYLVSQQQDIRQRADYSTANIQDPGFTSFIILAANTSEIPKYQELSGTNKQLSLRTVYFDPQNEINLFESNGWNYYVTVSSSDFIAHQNSGSLYNYDINKLTELAQNPKFRGFYFHEMMTYRALVSQWNWDTARDTVDWGWVQQIVTIAQNNNKKVIWSEPTYAWKTMYESQAVMDLFAQWGSTVVPMYATNFTDAEIASAKEFSTKVAQKYGLFLGQSHQGWHWQNSSGGTEPTREGSYNLAFDGWNSGVRYFQFEGNVNDFLWDSNYMLGIRDFSNFVSTQYQQPTSTPTPIPPTSTSTPVPPTPSPASINIGYVNVATSPPTNADIKILTKSGQIVLTGIGSINTTSLTPNSYYVSFSYPKTLGLIIPKTSFFRVYAGKTAFITGDFKTGKTIVVYK